jgi:hypothetical protein
MGEFGGGRVRGLSQGGGEHDQKTSYAYMKIE